MSHDRPEPEWTRLRDGARVAVIGGGPAGSFFGYFCLQLARRMDYRLQLDIYESRDFTRRGPGGCNHCGGIISESLVQILSTEGINIPGDVVRQGINSYVLHLDDRSVRIGAPAAEKRIAAIFRGGGPRQSRETGGRSFDDFLLRLTQKKGARVLREEVTGIHRQDQLWRIETRHNTSRTYHLLAGAVGLRREGLDLLTGSLPGYRPPRTTQTFISEFHLGEDQVHSSFGNAMHIFLLKIRRLRFAALIPKGPYVTLVLLGKDIDRPLVREFLNTPQVRKHLPPEMDPERGYACSCNPPINIRGMPRPWGPQWVLVGDCGTSKLYKNGIGAAYLTAKAAAATAVLQGITARDFSRHYRPICRSLSRDNRLGRGLFWITARIQGRSGVTKGLARLVLAEPGKKPKSRVTSGILWDLFTGSASYRSILRRILSPRCWFLLLQKILLSPFLPAPAAAVKEIEMKGKNLGRTYRNGEIIIRQGTVGNCLYVIQSGTVEVIREEADRQVLIARLGKNDFFGEMAIFEQDVRSSSVCSVGKSRILTIDKKTLLSTIQKNPSLAFRILERMSRRIRQQNRELSRLLQSSGKTSGSDPR